MRIEVIDTCELPDGIYYERPEWLVSDLHLGAGDGSDDFAPNKRLFCEFLVSIGREPLHVLGDLAELWQATPSAVYAAHGDLLDALATHPGTRVAGNHDWASRAFAPGSVVEVWHDPRHRLVGWHGHQPDVWNSTLMPVGWLATVAVGLVERVWPDADTAALSVWRKVEAVNRARPSQNDPDKHLPRYEAAIVSLMTERRAKVGAWGHTHRPYVQRLNGYLLANAGAWVNGHTTAIRLDGRLAELVRVVA